MGKTNYTKITPLPQNIPRQLALDLLHSHEELIRLNPLVTGVDSIERPNDARLDEYYANWYQIHEIMTWGPGMRKKMSFRGVFHDIPNGLQSHTYAPLSTDLRQRYTIGGNQPGEPPELPEIGVEKPKEGLYLREDHEINCAVPLTAGFVKKEMKAATAVMVERMNLKASLLGEGKLHAMFEAGKLKTAKPSQAPTFDNFDISGNSSNMARRDTRSSSGGGGGGGGGVSPVLDSRGFGHYYDVARAQSIRSSMLPPPSSSPGPAYRDPYAYRPMSDLQQQPPINELSGMTYHPRQAAGEGSDFIAELPGDFTPLQSPRHPSSFSRPRPASALHPQHNTHYEQQPLAALSETDIPQPLRYPQRAVSTSSSNYQSGPPSTIAGDTPSSIQAEDAFMASRHDSQRSGTSSAPPITPRDPSHTINGGPYVVDGLSRLAVSDWMEKVPPASVAASQPYVASQQDGHNDHHDSDQVIHCPVCKDFEGDETAVNFHYQRSHVSSASPYVNGRDRLNV